MFKTAKAKKFNRIPAPVANVLCDEVQVLAVRAMPTVRNPLPPLPGTRHKVTRNGVTLGVYANGVSAFKAVQADARLSACATYHIDSLDGRPVSIFQVCGGLVRRVDLSGLRG